MRTFLVYGFWIWFCVSMAILVWRRFDKKPDPSDASAPSVPTPEMTAREPAVGQPRARATTEPRTSMRTLAALSADPEAAAMATDDIDETQLLPAVAAARRAELGLPPLVADIARPEADVQPATEAVPAVPDGPLDSADPEMLQPAVAAAMREQTIAGATPATSSLFEATGVDTITAPLTQSLAGISMPVGLAPLANVGDYDGPDQIRERLTMWTAEATAGEVATAVAAELTRLGHSVAALDSSSAVARRGHEAVEIRIYQDPESVMAQEGMMFPTAPPKSVVVDFLAG
ncbi:MAG: hypothetical protein HKN26_03410 [Acidimicrobiales bacterium]|nr:hypothetical protein [Acidimicrobiales bacterium]